MTSILSEKLIIRILSHLDPADAVTVRTLVACQLVSKSFSEHARLPSLWRPLLALRWKHSLAPATEKAEPSDEYKCRVLLERKARSLIQVLVGATHNRTPIIARLCGPEFGHQVLEELLRLSTVESEKDVNWMGTRYWATVCLELLMKRTAFEHYIDPEQQSDQNKRGAAKLAGTLLIPLAMALTSGSSLRNVGVKTTKDALDAIGVLALMTRLPEISTVMQEQLHQERTPLLASWDAFVAQSLVDEKVPLLSGKFKKSCQKCTRMNDDIKMEPESFKGSLDIGSVFWTPDQSSELCVIVGKGFKIEEGELRYFCRSSSDDVQFETNLKTLQRSQIQCDTPEVRHKFAQLCKLRDLGQWFLRIEPGWPFRFVPNACLVARFPPQKKMDHSAGKGRKGA